MRTSISPRLDKVLFSIQLKLVSLRITRALKAAPLWRRISYRIKRQLTSMDMVILSTLLRIGTHVAGTAIGKTYGVAKAARVKAIKVCDAQGECATSDIIAGIEFAVKDAATSKGSVNLITSMSIGLPPSRALDAAANAAVLAGVAFVCSAGNGYG
jgi:hypothetical protein